MDWQAIGSIAQVIGALAVVLSLIYLSIQVRQSTKATNVATAHATSSAIREWIQPMMEDVDLSWTFTVGAEDPGRLDERERVRFGQCCFTYFRMFEDAFYQYEHGTLDPALWDGYKIHLAAYAKSPGMLAYWKERRHTYHPRFREFLDGYEPPPFERIGPLARGSAWSVEGTED